MDLYFWTFLKTKEALVCYYIEIYPQKITLPDIMVLGHALYFKEN